MAIFFDACRNGVEWRFRLWDSQTRTYATKELDVGRVLIAAKRLLAEGGVHKSPDASSVALGWLELAMERGTSDPTKPSVDVSKRAWRTTGDTEPAAGPIRTALRAKALSEQAVQSILERRLSEWMALLSHEARAFLDETFVLREFQRGGGTATVRVENEFSSARRGYDDLAHAKLLVAEIAEKWADAVSVETVDPGDPKPVIFLFRLR